MNTQRNIVMLAFGILAVVSFQVISSAAPGTGRRAAPPPDNTPRTLAPYFAPAAPGAKAPDADGFLQRWLLLEPISLPIRSNAGLTQTFVRETITAEYFANQLTVLPKNGDKVTVNGVELAWHALDSSTWNAKVFRFAYGVNKPTYGVLFWAVTLIDCPQEIPNVRMAVGSNAASIWWLNGEETVHLFGDRHMMMDDGVSKRLTLKKGRNIIRGAVINGPGLSDFCVRFIDEQRQPVKGFTMNLEAAN
jgi:hypothetical protein